MKRIAIAAVVLTSPAILFPVSLLAQPGPVRCISTPHIRLAVVENGKSARDVLIEISSGRVIKKLATGASGILDLPKLPEGPGVISAVAQNRGRGQACLNISGRDDGAVGLVTISLNIPLQHTIWRSGNGAISTPEVCDEFACLSPSKFDVKKFTGIATDPTGVGIASTQITILRKGVGWDRISNLSSDAHGQFSANLPQGQYVAYFRAAGFRTEIIPIVISSRGKHDLRVKLLVGATSAPMVIAN